MKTHDLAKALSQLTKVLRSLPNQEISELGSTLAAPEKDTSNDIGVSLSILAALSKFSKSDWEKIARDFDIPVDIRPRDAARDIMGKILNYLAENDAERERVAMKARSSEDQPSELSNALKFLLSND
ncbi:hypothetical protein PXK30_00010 [Phaeobacter gallaeciensis]|uniref:hypothetical protein n=1 Tax=Phaeobacter gallaeciensis TaxID=60890 RepID=UPI00237F6374|nr:hypothetical protein [Phaeobacter gallaeciensis]MDE4302077.1 hypothetical protein [Phaeobacter gallaeciensis]MDE4306946.1 hypothetical protein [Phaeobacter gallaeciensis]MDE4310935.1 hypothetical protein [Phaeobacter gallaeciensis]MDE4315398.1 hypothetical protein [Phaeobacter gallaeciensis]MDE4319862.1 hypothetical protein [Phaeobacter gallaeciensis]